jgi:fatty-acyl-CoA synthase
MGVVTSTSFLDGVLPFGRADVVWDFMGRRTIADRCSLDELAHGGLRVAASLRRRGVRAGDMVAVALDNTLASVTCALGVWSAGATLASIPAPGRSSKATHLDGIARVLLRHGCEHAIGPASLRSLLPDGIEVVDAAETRARSADLRPADAIDPPERTLVQFTSGSTGNPKGVAVRGDAIVRHVAAVARHLDADPATDSAASWLPLSHDMGLIGFLLTPLLTRSRLVLAEPASALDVRRWFETVGHVGATVTGGPDFFFRAAARALRSGRFDGDMSRLRVVMVGAERVQWSTLESFAEATTPAGFRWEAFMPVYGLAEATLAVTMTPTGRGPRRASDDSVLLGPALPGTEVRAGASATAPGRIEIRGPSLLDAYVGEADRDPLDADGWFATNDSGFLEHGQLSVLGRLDEATIVRGRNIFAEDVEICALACGATVAAAYRTPSGDGLTLVAEAPGPDDEARTALVKEIRAEVVRALDVHLDSVIAVRRRSIPVTTSGKVRRSAARERFSTASEDIRCVG